MSDTKKVKSKKAEVSSRPKPKAGIILGKDYTIYPDITTLLVNSNCERTSTRAGVNKSVAVYGTSGTGKTKAYAINRILQAVRDEESLIITDSRGELYKNTAVHLRNSGYDVKVLNLVNPENSDMWDCLQAMVASGGDAESFIALLGEVILGDIDLTLRQCMMSLLEALYHYLMHGDNYADEEKNIDEMCKLLTIDTCKHLQAMFDVLHHEHPTREAFTRFQMFDGITQSSAKAILASRLQSVRLSVCSEAIKAPNDIDFSLTEARKSAVFCIVGGLAVKQRMISALFFRFALQELMTKADSRMEGKLSSHVHFIFDGITDIGHIPDLDRIFSSLQKRKMSVSLIFQSIAQLEAEYPGKSMELINCCDSQLYMGSCCKKTLEHVASLLATSSSKAMLGVGFSSNNEKMAYLRGLEREKGLASVRGEWNRSNGAKELVKMDYNEHPDASMLSLESPMDYIPQRIINAGQSPPCPSTFFEVEGQGTERPLVLDDVLANL